MEVNKSIHAFICFLFNFGQNATAGNTCTYLLRNFQCLLERNSSDSLSISMIPLRSRLDLDDPTSWPPRSRRSHVAAGPHTRSTRIQCRQIVQLLGRPAVQIVQLFIFVRLFKSSSCSYSSGCSNRPAVQNKFYISES